MLLGDILVTKNGSQIPVIGYSGQVVSDAVNAYTNFIECRRPRKVEESPGTVPAVAAANSQSVAAIKTEIQLSEEMVAKIVASETSKALVKVPEFLENMVKQMLFSRPKKEYSYSEEKPTMYESLVQKYLKLIVENEMEKAAEEWRPKLRVIIKKAFKTNVLDNKEFEDHMLKQLAKFSSNITFYVPDSK
jgi:hypothetical protein